MRRSAFAGSPSQALGLALTAALVVTACQYVAGFDSRRVDPTSGAQDDAGAEEAGGSSSVDAWTSHLFADGLLRDAEVLHTERFPMEQTVEIIDDATEPPVTFMAPITSRYGLRSVIRIAK
jgi:hypothetical protein